MSLPPDASAGAYGSALPACVANCAVAPHILRKVEPRPVGPDFVPIPVRIMIGADGRVAHIHVIKALPEQKKSIEDALRQWEFEPYQSGGHTVPVETGLVFEFKPPAR
ncbi:MAG TPA: energy transducer TonB [Stellaceae bacterium]